MWVTGSDRRPHRLSRQAVQAERRDPFMTHGAENRGHDGVPTGLLGLLQSFSGRPDKPVDLRLCVERVTGIEPAWPAWKAGALPLSYTRGVPAQRSGSGR